MNTRKFPRTTAEAFPRGPEYGCAVERPLPSFWTPVQVVLAIVYLIALAVLGVVL